MDKSEKDLSGLLRNMQKALRVYSLKDLNFAISKALTQKDKSNRTEECEYAIDIVCEHYKISKRKIMTTRLGGEVTIARQVAVGLLHFELSMKQVTIAKIFEITPHHINLYVRKIKTLDPAIRWDREFKENYSILKSKLERFIQNQQNEHTEGIS